MIKLLIPLDKWLGERGGLVVESMTLKRKVGGSIPTSAVLCL